MRFKRILIALVFSAFAFLLLYKLGDNYLSNWDEAWYADIARNMARTGNILTPIFNQQPFLEKPPFYYWLSFLSFKIFSVSEFAARFPSALAGFGTGFLVFLLGKRLISARVGLFSVIILASTIGFIYRSRTGNLDSVLAFLILGTIYSFFIKKYILMGIFIALAFLTKGFIAYLVPGIVIAYLVLKRDKEVLKKDFIKGILISILIPVSWIILNIAVSGDVFIFQFFHNQTEKFSGTFSFWQNFSLDFFMFLKSGLKYWLILFIPAFIYSIYKWRKSNLVILSAFFLIYFGLLLFSRNKSNWFLMPLYPLTSLIIAWGIEEIGKRFKISFGLLLIPALGISIFTLVKFQNEYIVPDVVVSEVNVAIKAKELTSDKDIIYLTNYYYPTTIFYSDRKVIAVYGESENITPWIKHKKEWKNILRNKGIYIISTDSEFNELKNNYPMEKFEVIYRSGEKVLVKKV